MIVIVMELTPALKQVYRFQELIEKNNSSADWDKCIDIGKAKKKGNARYIKASIRHSGSKINEGNCENEYKDLNEDLYRESYLCGKCLQDDIDFDMALVSRCKSPSEETDHNEQIARELLRPGQWEIQKIAQEYLKEDGCKDDEKEKNDKNIDHSIYHRF